jgi:CheY-like chemotaxis protein
LILTLPLINGSEDTMNNKITVLVVEDEALLRMNTVDELTEQGLSVMEAANAKEAIALFNTGQRFECIFTDVDMPGDVDGLELAALVKDAFPPIEVIVTSGHRDVHRDDLPPRGVFVGKPYSLEVVGDLIRRLKAM